MIGWKAFLALHSARHILLDLFGVAMFGGMFVVPLYAVLTTTVDKLHTARTVAANNIVLKRRDTGAKEVLAQADVAARIASTLAQMQTDLYAAAKQRLKSNTVLANSIDEVESILADVTAEKGGGKFVMAHLKDDPACDARLKEFKATVRCIPLVDEFDGPGKCIVTGELVDRRVVIDKSY